MIQPISQENFNRIIELFIVIKLAYYKLVSDAEIQQTKSNRIYGEFIFESIEQYQEFELKNTEKLKGINFNEIRAEFFEHTIHAVFNDKFLQYIPKEKVKSSPFSIPVDVFRESDVKLLKHGYFREIDFGVYRDLFEVESKVSFLLKENDVHFMFFKKRYFRYIQSLEEGVKPISSLNEISTIRNTQIKNDMRNCIQEVKKHYGSRIVTI